MQILSFCLLLIFYFTIPFTFSMNNLRSLPIDMDSQILVPAQSPSSAISVQGSLRFEGDSLSTSLLIRIFRYSGFEDGIYPVVSWYALYMT